jgi:hypothetical protein
MGLLGLELQVYANSVVEVDVRSGYPNPFLSPALQQS